MRALAFLVSSVYFFALHGISILLMIMIGLMIDPNQTWLVIIQILFACGVTLILVLSTMEETMFELNTWHLIALIAIHTVGYFAQQYVELHYISNEFSWVMFFRTIFSYALIQAVLSSMYTQFTILRYM